MRLSIGEIMRMFLSNIFIYLADGNDVVSPLYDGISTVGPIAIGVCLLLSIFWFIFLKNTKIIVHPDNISVKATKGIIEMCGAIPTPSTIGGMKNFINCIEHSIKKKDIIQIYPEAHIWPYYTKIRCR